MPFALASSATFVFTKVASPPAVSLQRLQFVELMAELGLPGWVDHGADDLGALGREHQ